jgi:DNA-directed RNA polymerase specialized sigma24 family protein
MTQLSPRQAEVLELRAQGLSYAQIGDQLGMTVASVAGYIERALAAKRRQPKPMCTVCGEDPAGPDGMCGFCHEELNQL